MKKVISLILSLAIMTSLAGVAGASSLPADDDIEAILDIMGIMTYDARGNFNEGSYVTRAALAKILVSASQYKGLASGNSRVSPFADVMYTHWGAPYISVASKNKFMTGYSNGYFKPDSYITYEDAISAILRLMGYTSADYTGAYPQAPIAKASDIGLSDEVSVSIGSYVSRSEMAKLVYNMLNTPSKGQDAIYAVSLGYKTTSELLTIGDVLDENVTGPVTVKAGTLSSLGLNSPRVYRNGKGASYDSIENYDVIYYSKKSNAVWAYSNKVTGLVNAIFPNKESPTSVTVGGNTYKLSYYAVQRAFGLDGIEVGETVTMLLDKNGNVCDAYNSSKLYESSIGVVISVEAKTITAGDGTKTTGYYATVLMPDGSTVDIPQKTDSKSAVGCTVSIDYKTSSYKITSHGGATVSGFVNASALICGYNTPIASNIKILETDDNGNVASVTLNRLDGVNLKTENVLLAQKNESGAIDALILKDVTGDMHKYGLITSVKRNTVSDGEGGSVPSTYMYNYDIGGVKGTIGLNGVTSDVSEGPAVFIYDDGELSEIKNLKRADSVELLTPSYATLTNGIKHRVSSNVLVYKIVDDTKIQTSLDEALSYKGTVWVYYDKAQSEGGLIRVIYLR